MKLEVGNIVEHWDYGQGEIFDISDGPTQMSDFYLKRFFNLTKEEMQEKGLTIKFVTVFFKNGTYYDFLEIPESPKFLELVE